MATDMDFTLTEQHLALLRRMYVTTPYAGAAPAIDSKRPYGNGDVLRDMAELLYDEFTQLRRGAQSDWLEDNEERLSNLHDETATALQIVLLTGEFRAGHYHRDTPYDSRGWYLVEDAVSS